MPVTTRESRTATVALGDLVGPSDIFFHKKIPESTGKRVGGPISTKVRMFETFWNSKISIGLSPLPVIVEMKV